MNDIKTANQLRRIRKKVRLFLVDILTNTSVACIFHDISSSVYALYYVYNDVLFLERRIIDKTCGKNRSFFSLWNIAWCIQMKSLISATDIKYWQKWLCPRQLPVNKSAGVKEIRHIWYQVSSKSAWFMIYFSRRHWLCNEKK